MDQNVLIILCVYLTQADHTQEQLIDLLASDGMLVKRPIVIQEDKIIIGNKPNDYASLNKD